MTSRPTLRTQTLAYVTEMSSKNRKTESDIFDRYMTPHWCVRQCMRDVLPVLYWNLPENPRILEPSAGDGVFVLKLRMLYPEAEIHAMDLDPTVGPWSFADHSYEGDFLETDFTKVGEFDLVIGNPPYSFAEEFIRESLRLSQNVVYILRIGFIGSEARVDFFRDMAPDYIMRSVHRPKFKLGKTDSCEYAWFCWGAQEYGAGILPKTQLRYLPPVPIAERAAG